MNIFPQINKDAKPHIPGFIIEIDKEHYKSGDQ